MAFIARLTSPLTFGKSVFSSRASSRINEEYSNLLNYYCDLAKVHDCGELRNFEILIDSGQCN